jgi:hypothetical protein
VFRVDPEQSSREAVKEVVVIKTGENHDSALVYPELSRKGARKEIGDVSKDVSSTP